jgi:hypothetical protein
VVNLVILSSKRCPLEICTDYIHGTLIETLFNNKLIYEIFLHRLYIPSLELLQHTTTLTEKVLYLLRCIIRVLTTVFLNSLYFNFDKTSKTFFQQLTYPFFIDKKKKKKKNSLSRLSFDFLRISLSSSTHRKQITPCWSSWEREREATG